MRVQPSAQRDHLRLDGRQFRLDWSVVQPRFSSMYTGCRSPERPIVAAS
ncbi:hypothetical protein C7S15_7392 [Burkholderia cepacia]|nr:hypothetical protein [Burkholderia cepacia]